MKRNELLVMLLGYLTLTAGLVWLFGPYGLIGCGAVLSVAAVFLDLEGE